MTEIKDEQRYIEVFSMTDNELYREVLFSIANNSGNSGYEDEKEDKLNARLYGYTICALDKLKKDSSTTLEIYELKKKLKSHPYPNDGTVLFNLFMDMYEMSRKNKKLREMMMEILEGIHYMIISD